VNEWSYVATAGGIPQHGRSVSRSTQLSVLARPLTRSSPGGEVEFGVLRVQRPRAPSTTSSPKHSPVLPGVNSMLCTRGRESPPGSLRRRSQPVIRLLGLSYVVRVGRLAVGARFFRARVCAAYLALLQTPAPLRSVRFDAGLEREAANTGSRGVAPHVPGGRAVEATQGASGRRLRALCY
jgi:hypothetical protein